MPMPSFQARKDQLSRPVRSEALSSSSRWTRGLPVRIGSESSPHPPLVIAFCDWFRTHRGAKEPTLRHYARGATDLLRPLGEDASNGNAQPLPALLLHP